MPRTRALVAIVLSCTLLMGVCQYLGGQAFADPDQFPLAWMAPVLRQISGPIFGAENVVRDAIARHGRRAAPDPRLVFLALDNDSVSIEEADLGMLDLKRADKNGARALELMTRGWPWPREIYALTIERLVAAGAKVVVFDLNFPTATPDDAPFHAALDAFRGQVVIGANFSTGTPRAFGAAAPSLSRPAETLIPPGVPSDDRVGIDNFWPDTDVDDVIRSAQYRMTLGQVTGAPSAAAGDETYLSLAALAAMKGGCAGSVPPGFDRQPFRFSGPAGTYAPHSIFEIFAPDYWQGNYKNGAFFRGKIVAIGGYGNWQHDEHPTPFGMMPGPEVQLNALNAVLHDEFLRETPAGVSLILVLLSGLLPLLIFKWIGAPWGRIAATALVNAVWLGTSFELFNRANLIVPVAAPLAIFNINGIFGLFYDTIVARREERRVRRTLERYVSRNVVSHVLDQSKEFVDSLGGAIKPATILFSDIRNFSAATARMDPQELVYQLNDYFSAMVECVFLYDGTLDKFIGDAVMAVWGNAHTSGPAADARNALRAANAMRDRLKELNKKWIAENRPTFEIGIGLNHGQVVIGNFGSPHRMEYSVIGDAVNTSWRLQEVTKELGEDLVFGESVAELVCDEFAVSEVSLYKLPKTHRQVRIYKLAGNSPMGVHDRACAEPAAAACV